MARRTTHEARESATSVAENLPSRFADTHALRALILALGEHMAKSKRSSRSGSRLRRSFERLYEEYRASEASKAAHRAKTRIKKFFPGLSDIETQFGFDWDDHEMLFVRITVRDKFEEKVLEGRTMYKIEDLLQKEISASGIDEPVLFTWQLDSDRKTKK